MMNRARFPGRFGRVVPLIAMAIGSFEAGCSSPGAMAPDAGVDAALETAGGDTAADLAVDTAFEIGSPVDIAPADIAPADVAGDSGAGDVSQGDRGGDSTGDPCRPPCWSKLLNGCVPEGACLHQLANYCYANGVQFIASPPGNVVQQTISKNGVVCVTVDLAHYYSDPSGNVLGRLDTTLDGATVITCTGEAPVTIPASCAISCSGGTCPP